MKARDDDGAGQRRRDVRNRKVLEDPAFVGVDSRVEAAARAAHRVAWTVRRPLRESAAVVSFTGFLRA